MLMLITDFVPDASVDDPVDEEIARAGQLLAELAGSWGSALAPDPTRECAVPAPAEPSVTTRRDEQEVAGWVCS